MSRAWTEADLKSCHLFHDLTLDERQNVCNNLTLESHPLGESIIKEGNENQILWVILQGQCEVLKATKQGNLHQLAVLEAGSVFGEMSFFMPAPHSATIRTLSKVDVLRLERSNYDHLLETCPTAAYKIASNTASVLAERLRKMDDWTHQLVKSSGEASKKEEWQEFRVKLYNEWSF